MDGQRFGKDLTSPVWRVAHKRFPAMVAPPFGFQGQGRFDDDRPTRDEQDAFSVLYCGASPEAAVVETAFRFRRDVPAISGILSESIVDVAERDAYAERYGGEKGHVPSEWRGVMQLQTAVLALDAPLFDLANPAALQWLRNELAFVLISLGLDDLDFSEVLGRNRELTRGIGRWVRQQETPSGSPMFAGIRFRSRFDPDAICYAIYADRYAVVGEIDTYELTDDAPGFAAALATLNLT